MLNGENGIPEKWCRNLREYEIVSQVADDLHQKIETGAVSGYKKVENGFVSGYRKIEDKFVQKFLARKGETTEEAKKRLSRK